MYYLSPEFLENTVGQGKSKGRILLFPSIGSQHTLGLFMLAEFFRKSGWEVCADPALSEQDIFSILGEKNFQVVGISIGSYDQKKFTKKLIRYQRLYGPALRLLSVALWPFVKAICITKLKLMDRQQTLGRQFYLLIPY